MKKITRLLLAVTCCLLLQSQVFGDIYTNALSLLGSRLATNITATGNAINNQIKTSFEELFSAPPSILDKIIRTNVENFLKIYATRKDFSNLDFRTTEDINTDALRTLLLKEVGYSALRNSYEKINDIKILLIQPFENTHNDFDPLSVDLPNPPIAFSPYGSMDYTIPEEGDKKTSLPNFSDLIGVDSYDKDNQNKAKLFISYMLQAVPAPKNFVIPDITKAANNKVYMYLPIADKAAHTQYSFKEISTKEEGSPGERYAEVPAGESKVEYVRMMQYLKSNSQYYQPYKMKVRIANVLRTLYTEGLYRSYQERIKDKSGLSLVEREKLVAMNGLDKSYYDSLVNGDEKAGTKPATLADLAIEGLKAINKLAYFIYRIHQDIERLNLITATTGMQLTAGLTDMQNDVNYVKPIGSLIMNSCWDKSLFPDDDGRINICTDPKSAAAQPKSTDDISM